ncbi:MAG: chromosome partitioning protein ParB [Flavobacteriaceae bacterium]|nr:MAG: chromosome partitioning protein ParB [Flavobacteriaceae bacterium]
MAKNKRALGRGLSALLNDSHSSIESAQDKGAESLVGNILEVELDSITVNPHQPRIYFDPEALQDLSDSIKELGVIQPITVRKSKDGFELISGERRFRASKLAGLETIPAYIRLANDTEMLEMALVENIQRQDLDAIEVALSYEKLIEEISLTQEELSRRVGKKRSTITNYLRLLKLEPSVQNAIRSGEISMGHGRALTAVEDAKQQMSLCDQIISQGLSVRQIEAILQQRKEKNIQTVVSEKQPKPLEVKNTQNFLEDKYQTKVDIKWTSQGKGKIIFDFDSLEQFNRIKNLLG